MTFQVNTNVFSFADSLSKWSCKIWFVTLFFAVAVTVCVQTIIIDASGITGSE